jgi:iron uptake system component EfeO
VTRLRRFAAGAAGVVGLAACSSSSTGGAAVKVTATDTACRVGTTTLRPGTHTFSVSNEGGKTTEVYVYGPNDKVVAEKENIGPGTKARFTAKVSAGSYQIACKPGQTGSGIRQTVTVA